MAPVLLLSGLLLVANGLVSESDCAGMTECVSPKCVDLADCTPDLQAAIDSGASVVRIGALQSGAAWVTQTLKLASDQMVVFAGATLLAKRGAFGADELGLDDGLGDFGDRHAESR